jgi:hypothetical protein
LLGLPLRRREALAAAVGLRLALVLRSARRRLLRRRLAVGLRLAVLHWPADRRRPLLSRIPRLRRATRTAVAPLPATQVQERCQPAGYRRARADQQPSEQHPGFGKHRRGVAAAWPRVVFLGGFLVVVVVF